MTATTHDLIPRTAAGIETKQQQYTTHSRLGLTEGCAAPGCRERHPCWVRRDSHRFLQSAGFTGLDLL